MSNEMANDAFAHLARTQLLEDYTAVVELCHVLIAELESYDEAFDLIVDRPKPTGNEVTVGDSDRGTAGKKRSARILIDLERIERELAEYERRLAVDVNVSPRHDRWPEYERGRTA